MVRLEGWEARLAEVIEWARAERYELGRHDCFRVVCRGVQALTGIDLWRDWAGSYRTQAQALRRIVEYGGSFDRAFSKLFGAELAVVQLARQGDVVKFIEPGTGMPHLGLCVGSDVALLKDDGLAFVPLSACACCWRIG